MLMNPGALADFVSQQQQRSQDPTAAQVAAGAASPGGGHSGGPAPQGVGQLPPGQGYPAGPHARPGPMSHSGHLSGHPSQAPGPAHSSQALSPRGGPHQMGAYPPGPSSMPMSAMSGPPQQMKQIGQPLPHEPGSHSMMQVRPVPSLYWHQPTTRSLARALILSSTDPPTDCSFF